MPFDVVERAGTAALCGEVGTGLGVGLGAGEIVGERGVGSAECGVGSLLMSLSPISDPEWHGVRGRWPAHNAISCACAISAFGLRYSRNRGPISNEIVDRGDKATVFGNEVVQKWEMLCGWSEG